MRDHSKPLVTIAIPTYNRADTYLRTTLESAFQQTYEPLEVIVVDNCSTDHTPDLVHAYEQKHANLRYIRHSENVGPLDNFQHSLDVASGAFFLLLHDDDCVDEDFVATCLEAADYDTSLGYIRTGIRCIDGTGRVVREHPNEGDGLQREAYINAWLQGKVFWYFSSCLLNTEKLRSVEPFTSNFEQIVDLSSFAKIALRTDGVDVRSVKASYREHDARTTNQTEMRTLIAEYSQLRDVLIAASSPDWQSTLQVHANEFSARLLCQYADEIPNKLKRLHTYVLIGRTFGLRHIPRPLSKIVRCVLTSSFEKYLDQKARKLRDTPMPSSG